MSQLLGLSVDELKIDKMFVLGLPSDSRAQAIVRSTIELGRNLELTVVAEGIETEAVLSLLRGLGADIGQGYVISRPLAPPQLDDYLAGMSPRRARSERHVGVDAVAARRHRTEWCELEPQDAVVP